MLRPWITVRGACFYRSILGASAWLFIILRYNGIDGFSFLFLAGPGSHIFCIVFGLVLSRRGRGPNTIFNGASCNISCKASAIVVSYVLEDFGAA